jgi:pimeloyl-ACP methyl ester carboxylesterase
MKTVSVPGTGTQVAYDALGEGPGLALLHGTSLDPATNFGHVTQRLSARRRVITPEYGGCGLSTIPPGPLSLEVAVEQIAAALGDAFDGPVDLVGESLGAVVAAATAARYPGLVRHLILVAGWASSADHVVIPSGHAIFAERPDDVCELVNTFLSR